MYRAAFYTTAAILLSQFRCYFQEKWKRNLGSGILKDTLKKVLLAPVNTFFDITPVGKILRIF